MLILLYKEYVNPAHIVRVTAHPTARDVCIVLSNGSEIRVEMEDRESQDVAVTRVGRYIQGKCHE